MYIVLCKDNAQFSAEEIANGRSGNKQANRPGITGFTNEWDAIDAMQFANKHCSSEAHFIVRVRVDPS